MAVRTAIWTIRIGLKILLERRPKVLPTRVNKVASKLRSHYTKTLIVEFAYCRLDVRHVKHYASMGRLIS